MYLLEVTLTTAFYLKCVLLGLIGLIFSLLLSAKLMVEQAKSTNTAMNWKTFFSWDITIQTVANVLAVATCLLILNDSIAAYPKLFTNLKILLLFAGIGFSGGVAAWAFLSRMKKKLLNSADVKTDITDKLMGNTSPTQALNNADTVVLKQAVAEGTGLHQMPDLPSK